MRALGLSDLSTARLVQICIHCVKPKSVREMEALGLGDLSLDRLIGMRIHGIDV